MNTSNTKFNMSLPIEYRSNHIFFYKTKIPRTNLLSIWSNLIPGKQKHYRILYLNLLKKQIKNKKSNWILKKKKLFSSFKKNLYLDKSRPVFKQELKPKLREFKEMYLKGYTPQEEMILIFNAKKQNIPLKPDLLKVNHIKVHIDFSKLRKIELPKYKLGKKPVEVKPLNSSLRTKLVKALFLKKKYKPFTLLSSSIRVKETKEKTKSVKTLKKTTTDKVKSF